MKTVDFICKSNPMSCAGNNYRMLLKEMVDLRDEFKEYQGFGREDVEGFIEMLCID